VEGKNMALLAAGRRLGTQLVGGAQCGLVGAHDDRHQALGIDAARKRGTNVGDAYFLDVANEIVEIRKRQPVIADRAEIVEDLAVAVDAQRKAADDVLLRLLQLVGVGPLRENP
jgi:hypothetical protein